MFSFPAFFLLNLLFWTMNWTKLLFWNVCRMPDPEFTVSEIKGLVGKWNTIIDPFCPLLNNQTINRSSECYSAKCWNWHRSKKKKIHISWALLFICNGSTKFCVQAAVAQWTWWMWAHRKAPKWAWLSLCATTRRRRKSAINCSTWSAWSSATPSWRTSSRDPLWYVAVLQVARKSRNPFWTLICCFRSQRMLVQGRKYTPLQFIH